MRKAVKFDARAYARQFENSQAALFIMPDRNAMMAVWTMPISWEPLRFAVSIGKNRHTHSLLQVGVFFELARVVPKWYDKAIEIFGRSSGRDLIKPDPLPYCEPGTHQRFLLEKILDVGDHSLVIGRMFK